MRLSFYACVYCIKVWKLKALSFQWIEKFLLKTQNYAAKLKMIKIKAIQNLGLSDFVPLISILVYFNRILWFNLTLQKTKYFCYTSEFSSHSKTQLHAENTHWKRLSQHSLRLKSEGTSSGIIYFPLSSKGKKSREKKFSKENIFNFFLSVWRKRKNLPTVFIPFVNDRLIGKWNYNFDRKHLF